MPQSDQRGLTEADFTLFDLPGYYWNRRDEPSASWPAALKVAKYLCSAFHSLFAESIERDLRNSEWHTIHGRQIAKDWIIEPETSKLVLEKERPIYDMVFSWCNVDVVERLNRKRALEDEITRLRRILTDVVWDYRLSGHPQLAARLEKKIHIEDLAD